MDQKLRELIKQWRELTRPEVYAIADGFKETGTLARDNNIAIYKTCADQLEKILNEQ